MIGRKIKESYIIAGFLFIGKVLLFAVLNVASVLPL